MNDYQYDPREWLKANIKTQTILEADAAADMDRADKRRREHERIRKNYEAELKKIDDALAIAKTLANPSLKA
jgi:hypothetical protein